VDVTRYDPLDADMEGSMYGFHSLLGGDGLVLAAEWHGSKPEPGDAQTGLPKRHTFQTAWANTSAHDRSLLAPDRRIPVVV
jgi:hypothetical protein